MVNGVFDKLGNWYEEDYVVWQCLRVLNGSAESVLWEGKHEDGDGIAQPVEEGDRGAARAIGGEPMVWLIRLALTPPAPARASSCEVTIFMN